jgi:hypothetical protein
MRPAGCWAPKQEKLGEGVNVSTGISVDGFELTRLNEAGQLSGAFADLGPRTCQCEFGQGAGRVRLGQTQCAFRCPGGGKYGAQTGTMMRSRWFLI